MALCSERSVEIREMWFTNSLWIFPRSMGEVDSLYVQLEVLISQFIYIPGDYLYLRIS